MKLLCVQPEESELAREDRADNAPEAAGADGAGACLRMRITDSGFRHWHSKENNK